MQVPDVQYAHSGDVAIAYQAVGKGRFRGIEQDTAGDGFFATFEGRGVAAPLLCSRCLTH